MHSTIIKANTQRVTIFFDPPQFSLDITFKNVLVFSSIPTSLARNPPLFPSAYVQRSYPVSQLAEHTVQCVHFYLSCTFILFIFCFSCPIYPRFSSVWAEIQYFLYCVQLSHGTKVRCNLKRNCTQLWCRSKNWTLYYSGWSAPSVPLYTFIL